MVTLADICQQYGPAYEAAFGDQLLPSHRQALRAIVQCRTAALGGHVYQCDACEQIHYCYHSCRNRHCPQCQGDKAADWLARQAAMLLPTPYFMLTFTLPAELRSLARSHQHLFYNPSVALRAGSALSRFGRGHAAVGAKPSFSRR